VLLKLGAFAPFLVGLIVKECVPLEAPDSEPDPHNPTDRSRTVLGVLGFEPLPLTSKGTVSQWTPTLGNPLLFP